MGSAYALVYCEPDFPRINRFFFFQDHFKN